MNFLTCGLSTSSRDISKFSLFGLFGALSGTCAAPLDLFLLPVFFFTGIYREFLSFS